MRLAAPFRRHHLITTASELFALAGVLNALHYAEIASALAASLNPSSSATFPPESLYWSVIEESWPYTSFMTKAPPRVSRRLDELTRFTRIAEDSFCVTVKIQSSSGCCCFRVGESRTL